MLLEAMGERLRARRRELGWSQAQLSDKAGVSARFLSDLEQGRGNISVQRLAEVCQALDLPLEELFRGLGPSCRDKLALVGLRGSGKSSIGKVLAESLRVPLVELDARIEDLAGMSLGEIFEISGEAHYHDLEARVLRGVLANPGAAVIATGGSIVSEVDTWRLLRDRTRTVWLRASPEALLSRVRNQGDLRPMAGRPNARLELEAILEGRSPLYAQADLVIDTEVLGFDGTVARLADWFAGSVRG